MPWLYTLTFVDAYDRQVQRRYEVVGADYATARANADLVLAAAQNWTEGYVAKESLAEVSDIAGAFTAGANVDEGATMQFSLGGTKKASISFPMPLKSTINSDSTVDLTDALVLAFTGLITGGNVLISDGESATAVIKGKLDK